jgi:hypothetical protein
MLQLTVDYGDLDRIVESLARLDPAMWDLRGLGERIGRILQVDNMQSRMMGVDYESQPFAPLAESTLRRRQGTGPPLAPMEMQSRVISGMEIEVLDHGAGYVEVVASWPSMPFLHFHVTGTRHMPSRDPVGIRPEAWGEIGDAVSEWVDNLMANWG